MKYTHHKQIINSLRFQVRLFYVLLFFVAVGVVLSFFQTKTLSPCPDSGCSVIIVYPKETPTVDSMIDKYANKYGSTTWKKLRTKVLLHYLLIRESAYGNTKKCGDSGLACGPLQFHDATYVAFREIMIDRGLVKEIGSRWDMENAVETAAWAINDGRENDWGPILRQEIKV